MGRGAGVVVLLAIFTSGFAASAAPAPTESRIVVTATGTAKAPPDIGQLSLALAGEGATQDAANREVAAKYAAVEQGLKSLAGIRGVRFATGSLNSTQVRALECEDRISATLSRGDCAVIGYLSRMQVTVDLMPVELSGTALSLAGRLGAASGHINFMLSDTQSLERQALAAALANAKVQAETIASASGARLGPLISVDMRDRYEIEGTQMSRITVTATGTAVPQPIPPVPVPVSAPDQDLSRSLTVVYAILP